MSFKIISKHVPVKITYVNAHGRALEVYGTFSAPTIRIGEKSYFRAISDPSELIQVNDKGRREGTKVGNILEFVFLDIGEQQYED